ncbi:hypothetical protein FB45DRAFT_5455 [Roridomyces roridus]|uniref:Uncharacterized protein n=1 Tax=Roridomyces roridus TaxID=1738132 RepID=A0AAD7CIL8_9AGAR|nr:hypothetical protein FB45DRAFT_5455 [Roridomyces roridus]
METVAQVAQRPPSQWPDTEPAPGPVLQRSELFQNAQNFEVVGGQFVAGDVHYHMAQTLGPNERALTVTEPDVCSPDPREAPALPMILQPTQAYADSEIYCNQLLQRKRGFPLYIPGPRANLSAEYRRNGISVGDVGSVTPEGSFDFFFNIYLPAGHPINTHTPEDFVPLAPYNVIDISQEDVAPGDYVSTRFVQHTTGVGFSQFPGDAFVFHCYNPTGAVLALPHGARQEKLGNLAAMRNYAAKNAESWYKYVNGTRGRELKNGSLYLVTGWEKSASWGIATFHDVISPRNELQLAFRPTADRSVGHRYRWQTCPARHKHADPAVDDNRLNQTTFIHGFSISLGDTFWQRLFGKISMCSLEDSQLLTSHTDFVPFGSQSSVLSWSFDFAGSSTAGGKSRAEAEISTSDLSAVPEIFLPGQLINDWILRQTHDAKVVITHDDDWADTLHDLASAVSISTERDFLRNLADKFVMYDEEGD